jgi:hypothetical protein
LKQALPCRDVAERQKGVLAAAGLDGGDADVVEADPDFGSQAGEVHLARARGQRGGDERP